MNYLYRLASLLKMPLMTALMSVSLVAQASQSFNHQDWNELLERHVYPINVGASTEVDYKGMQDQHKLLKHYLSNIAAVSQTQFDSWSSSEQLAFLINTYNAATVELILTQFPDLESIKDIGSFFQSPWKIRFIRLLGKKRSLDEIEHELIRGSEKYNDPRIHFAVNCASVGCPALSPKAYQAETLDAQLETATQTFLADSSRNRFENGELKISSIFKWYREDFEKSWRGNKSLAQFLSSYSQALKLDAQTQALLAADRIDIDFLDYDWRLNRI
jgi:hypothetical protein